MNHEEPDLKTVKSIYNKLKAYDKSVTIEASQIKDICTLAKDVLLRDQVLLQIQAAVNVIGDIHGQFTDLLKLLGDDFKPEKDKYLFLGDYVDRGPNSVEVMIFLLCCKILYKDNIFLLRGNHETEDISTLYGFKDELLDKYPSKDLHSHFVTEVFDNLPLAAVISNKIFCVHGGLSQHLESKNENETVHDISKLFNFSRPINGISDNEFVSDLLWADPSPDTNGYTPSERGTSYTFGCDAADKFLADYGYELICRAHQVVDNGFDFPFFPKRSVITIFSAPNYCDEFNNKSAMLKIDDTLKCTFKIIDPNDPDYAKK